MRLWSGVGVGVVGGIGVSENLNVAVVITCCLTL
jgi:hypothetical protein